VSTDNNGNFHNGALVFRVWKDGSGEIIAKFQYLTDAERYADQRAKGDDGTSAVAFVAVCEFNCYMRSYKVKTHNKQNDDAVLAAVRSKPPITRDEAAEKMAQDYTS
jgi:hypothetical protein